MHVSWEVAHTWEEWRDLYLYVEYRFPEQLKSLPPFPTAHLLMTTLLMDERVLGMNRKVVREGGYE